MNFINHSFSYCADINECEVKSDETGPCGVNTICTNTPGGFNCRCKLGFIGDPYKECICKLIMLLSVVY